LQGLILKGLGSREDFGKTGVDAILPVVLMANSIPPLPGGWRRDYYQRTTDIIVIFL